MTALGTGTGIASVVRRREMAPLPDAAVVAAESAAGGHGKCFASIAIGRRMTG